MIMQKVLIILLCLFLCLVLIGASLFPYYSFEKLISVVYSKTITPFVNAINAVKDVSSAFDFEGQAAYKDSIYDQKDFLLGSLSMFIPYHIDKYSLRDRCQGGENTFFYSFARLLEIDNNEYYDNQVCRLICHFDKTEHYLEIHYDAYDDKIVQVSFHQHLSGNYTFYRYDKEEALFLYEWHNNGTPSISNEFYLSEVEDYIRTVDITVYYVKKTEVYHSTKDCSYISSSSNVITGKIGDAFNAGIYRGCSRCFN